MKFNFKAMVIAMGFVMTSGLLAAPIAADASPVVDPDLAVYNAIASLCTDVAIAELTTSAAAQALLDTIGLAKTFLRADETTPDASSAGIVLANLDTWTTNVTAKKAALSAADDAAKAQKTFSDAITAATTLEALSGVFALFATGGSLVGKEASMAPTDIASLYTKIASAYVGIFSQTTGTLSTYLNSVSSLLSTANVSKLVFADKTLFAVDLTKLDASKLTQAINTTNVGAVLGDAIFTSAAKSWRTLKNKMPK